MKLTELTPRTVYITTGSDDQAAGGRFTRLETLVATGDTVEIVVTSQMVRSESWRGKNAPRRDVKRARLHPVPGTAGLQGWCTTSAPIDLRGSAIYAPLHFDGAPVTLDRFDDWLADTRNRQAATERAEAQARARTAEISDVVWDVLAPSAYRSQYKTWPQVTLAGAERLVALIEVADALADAADLIIEQPEAQRNLLDAIDAYRELRGRS